VQNEFRFSFFEVSCTHITHKMPNGYSIALKALQRSRSTLSDKEILEQIRYSKKINVWTCTWNMHAKSWPEDLGKALGISDSQQMNHMYVIGTQECQKSILTSAFLPSKWMWESSLIKCFGDRYALVRSETMQALHVVVFVHRALLPHVKDIHTASVPTGIRIKPTSVRLGNKGGVGIRFCVGKTRFAFVTCHLSAHQHRVRRRNEDFARINAVMNMKMNDDLKKISKKGSLVKQFFMYIKKQAIRRNSRVATSYNLTMNESLDHQVWLGDFNYRIDHNDPEIVIKTINEGKYMSLLSRDQLSQERHKDKSFPGGLKEGNVTFKPTYKFDPNTDNYARKKRRIPSWTDRILYVPKKGTKLVKYISLDEIRTSDHRPVVGVFSCVVSGV